MSSPLALYVLLAVGVATALVALLHRLEPEYDPSWRMLSEYSLGRYGIVMRVAFLAAGSAVVVLAAALSAAAWPAALALAIVAIGPIGAAFIDTDPITTPRTEMSGRSNVHGALGAIFILGFPVAATLVGLALAGDAVVGPGLAWASLAPWLALAWFLGVNLRAAGSAVAGSPDVRIGWPNRVSMLADVGWVALAAATAVH